MFWCADALAAEKYFATRMQSRQTISGRGVVRQDKNCEFSTDFGVAGADGCQDGFEAAQGNAARHSRNLQHTRAVDSGICGLDDQASTYVGMKIEPAALAALR